MLPTWYLSLFEGVHNNEVFLLLHVRQRSCHSRRGRCLERNKATFDEEAPNIIKLIGDIKTRTWNWITTKMNVLGDNNFSEWCDQHRNCCT
ncbi:hypothetical protein ACS0TY_020383 [Phlomoides rotata]